jgi:hypothetical protein
VEVIIAHTLLTDLMNTQLLGYELDNRGLSHSMGRDCHHIHTSSGTHSASYPIDKAGSLFKSKVTGVWS